MKFDVVLAQVFYVLQWEGRVSYQARSCSVRRLHSL
jgi:hypothetical protein